MCRWYSLVLMAMLASVAAFAMASDKEDIDTSPHVFASASGKYWVRITTKREYVDEGNKWTTNMVLYHAEQGSEKETVVYQTTLNTFPRRALVSDFGQVVTLDQCVEVSVKSIITVFGRDGKPRGETEYIELLKEIPSGPERQEAFRNLASGAGATFNYYHTPHILNFPLGDGKVARLSMDSGRPWE